MATMGHDRPDTSCGTGPNCAIESALRSCSGSAGRQLHRQSTMDMSTVDNTRHVRLDTFARSRADRHDSEQRHLNETCVTDWMRPIAEAHPVTGHRSPFRWYLIGWLPYNLCDCR